MPETPSPSVPEPIKKLHVLVAEQNAALQKSIVTALKTAGFEHVRTAANGGDAWHTWKHEQPVDVLLCDAGLPEMSGLDILSHVRGDATISQPPFLLISSDDSDLARKEAQDGGCDVFLPKPFPADQVVPRLLEAVAARQSGVGAHAAIVSALLGARLPVELIFDRYTTEVECEELTPAKCVIRVTNNYGLGTQLNMSFKRPEGEEAGFKPIKGVVMKTERVPKEYGVYRLHVQFSGKPREEHGIAELIRTAAAGQA